MAIRSEPRDMGFIFIRVLRTLRTKIDIHRARLGLGMTEYIVSLVEKDLAGTRKKQRRIKETECPPR